MEAYGPGGVALLIKILTDNKNRSFSEIKNILSKNGAKTADSGSVAYLFSPRGEIKLASSEHQPIGNDKIEELIVESGANDFEDIKEGFLVYTAPKDLGKVKKYFEEKGLSIEGVKIVQEAKELLEIRDKEIAEKIIKLLESLEDHEDVDEVYTNFDIPDDLIGEIN
jgi:YebC/PmpR family DNA-binding regulatory protein